MPRTSAAPLQHALSVVWLKSAISGGCICNPNYPPQHVKPQTWGLWGLGASKGIPNLIEIFTLFLSTSLCPSHRPHLSSKSAIRKSSKPLEIQTFHLLTSKGLVKQNFHPRMTHENHFDATTPGHRVPYPVSHWVKKRRSEQVGTNGLRKRQNVVEGVKGV